MSVFDAWVNTLSGGAASCCKCEGCRAYNEAGFPYEPFKPRPPQDPTPNLAGCTFVAWFARGCAMVDMPLEGRAGFFLWGMRRRFPTQELRT